MKETGFFESKEHWVNETRESCFSCINLESSPSPVEKTSPSNVSTYDIASPTEIRDIVLVVNVGTGKKTFVCRKFEPRPAWPRLFDPDTKSLFSPSSKNVVLLYAKTLTINGLLSIFTGFGIDDENLLP